MSTFPKVFLESECQGEYLNPALSASKAHSPNQFNILAASSLPDSNCGWPLSQTPVSSARWTGAPFLVLQTNLEVSLVKEGIHSVTKVPQDKE